MHAPDILDDLPPELFKGFLEEASPDVPAATTELERRDAPPVATSSSAQSMPAQPEDSEIPPLESILSAGEFASVASKALTPKTWAFYSSAATDLITHAKNKELVRRIMIRPRVLRNVTTVNFETSILGFKSSAPFFIAPAAMAKLVHPDGELALSRGAANEGILQCVSDKAHFGVDYV